MSKKVSALVIALALVLGLGVGAVAASNNETIQAILSRDITIKYDGEIQKLHDVNGNEVFPIAYNGTTYIPVRAVSGLLDIPVQWDNDNRQVILGEANADKLPLYKVEATAETTSAASWYATDRASSIAWKGVDYNYEHSLFKWQNWNGTHSDNETTRIKFNIGDFTKISFGMIADHSGTFSVYDSTGKVLKTWNLTPGEYQDVTVDITGAQSISLGGNANGMLDWDSCTYLLDPTLHN